MSSTAELFYVKLADGDVHRVSLDQLDDAFQAGHIDGATMVLADGSDRWTTLGELAGMDEEDDEEIVAPVQVIPQNAPRMPEAAPVVHAPTASMKAQYPEAQPSRQGFEGPTGASQDHAAQYTQWQAPRVQAQLSAPPLQPASMRNPYAQTMGASMGHSQMPQPFVPNSARPVSVDLGEFDPDLKRTRRGSGKRWVATLVGLSLLGAAGGIAVARPPWAQPYLNRVGLRTGSVSVAAAEAPPRAVEAALIPQPAPPPAPPQVPPPAASAPAGNDSPLSPRFTDRFTPEQKEKLAEADKMKKRGHAKGGGAPSSGSKAKSTTFTTGGNKFDPLNSSI